MLDGGRVIKFEYFDILGFSKTVWRFFVDFSFVGGGGVGVPSKLDKFLDHLKKSTGDANCLVLYLFLTNW